MTEKPESRFITTLLIGLALGLPIGFVCGRLGGIESAAAKSEAAVIDQHSGERVQPGL